MRWLNSVSALSISAHPPASIISAANKMSRALRQPVERKAGDVLRAVEQRGEPALREDQRVEDDGDERDRRKGDQRDEQSMRGKDKMVADMHDEQRGRKRTDQLGKQDAQQDAHDQGERADDHRLEDEDDGHAAALHAQDMIRTEFLDAAA